MTIQEVGSELRQWKFTKQRAWHFGIASIALLVYEFIARPFYRPYIYANNIFDFHLADTIGNTLGTITTIFTVIGLLGRTHAQHKFLITVSTMAVCSFEIMHPLLGKAFDAWDFGATVLSGWISYKIYHLVNRDSI